MKSRSLLTCALAACPSACLAFLPSSQLMRAGPSPDMIRRRSSQSSSLSMTVTGKSDKDITVAVAGSTGYIGKFVAMECVRRGYKTIALTRNPDAVVEGAEMVVADVTDPASIEAALAGRKVDGMVSCLASRSGTKSDSFAIDYQATLNCLEAAKKEGAAHFVMLSAFCVKKPTLQFQKAKLKFEKELVAAGDAGEIGYSIVRPTAFFKSVSGQLEVVQSGAPFVVFGDGTMCKCNPIAEADLATYLVDCITDKSKGNKILNIGGPDDGLTMTAQGKLLFEAVGKEPKILKAPVLLFDLIIGSLDFMATLLPKQFEDPAELAKIGKYYAVEDMLTTDPSEKFGTVTLGEHYKRIAVEGNDYDPYTTLFAGKKKPTGMIASLLGNSVEMEEEEQPVVK